MVLRGAGTIVLVSSDAAVEAYARWGAYSISKAAQDHLGRVLGAELAGTGVRVLSIDPGELDTEMHAAAIPDADPTSLLSPDVASERILSIAAEPRALETGARVAAASFAVAEHLP
jgi:NAD(P)-dependent dehydrogenase (short-subunit alcohol dehydrogenase family)